MKKNKACRPTRQGFTLIELIVYVAVFVIISVTITLFVFDLIRVYAKVRITKQVSESSQMAIEKIISEINHAESVYSPTSSFDSHPGQLSLKTEKNAPDNEEAIYIDFYLDNNNHLCLKKEGQNEELMTPENINVNRLIFNHLTDGSVRIELSTNYRLENEKISYQATTTIFSSANLRND